MTRQPRNFRKEGFLYQFREMTNFCSHCFGWICEILMCCEHTFVIRNFSITEEAFLDFCFEQYIFTKW